MAETKPRRPDGLTIIAILWFISGLINIYMSFQTISLDLELYSYLNYSIIHPWFNFGIIAEMIIAIFIIILGIIQLITVFGLWTGKPYSYRLTLIVPIFLLIVNLSSAVLYASAPAELGLGGSTGFAIAVSVSNIIWLVIVWDYLGKPHVKAYLGIAQPKSTTTEKLDQEIPEKPLPVTDTKPPSSKDKFFCRYCGAENEADAVYCEKCGKKLK